MLHIISQSLNDPTVLQRIGPGDTVLFIRTAVLGLAARGCNAEQLAVLQRQCRLYVLQPDLDERGVSFDSLVPGMTPVDYAGFVDLAVEHPNIMSWC